MPVSDKFYRDAVKKNIINQGAQKGPSIILGTGVASAAEQERILSLHTDTRFQSSLRDDSGARVYPADYAPADTTPAN